MSKVLVALMLAVLLAGPARGAAAADKLVVGVLKLVSSGPIYLAQDKGYFKAEGLDVELKFFEAAQPVSVAVVSGDIDVGITGLTGGFYNLAGKGEEEISSFLNIADARRLEPDVMRFHYVRQNSN